MSGLEEPPGGLLQGAYPQVQIQEQPTESGMGQSRPYLTLLHGFSSLVSVLLNCLNLKFCYLSFNNSIVLYWQYNIVFLLSVSNMVSWQFYFQFQGTRHHVQFLVQRGRGRWACGSTVGLLPMYRPLTSQPVMTSREFPHHRWENTTPSVSHVALT